MTKFRSHLRKRLNAVHKQLLASNTHVARKIKGYKVASGSISLSEQDRITFITTRDKNNTVLEVTSVSYQYSLEDKWYTAVYYDSEHGYLERHTLISLNPPQYMRNFDGVISEGEPHEWLTWAINDLMQNVDNYRGILLKTFI